MVDVAMMEKFAKTYIRGGNIVHVDSVKAQGRQEVVVCAVFRGNRSEQSEK